VDEQHHGALALDQADHVGEDAVDGGLHGGLLLEDDPGQVQQHLVPLHLQLGALVDLGVAQPDAAELEVLLEERLIVGGEVSVVRLVDHLRHPNHVSRGVLSGIARSLFQYLCFKGTVSILHL
jgi:hypothetical protein